MWMAVGFQKATHQMNKRESTLDDVLAEFLTLTKRVDNSGTIRYFNSAGVLHRVHGPAVIYANGNQYWLQDGVRHRTDGPAVIWGDGSVFWYHHDRRLPEPEWRKITAEMGTTL